MPPVCFCPGSCRLSLGLFLACLGILFLLVLLLFLLVAEVINAVSVLVHRILGRQHVGGLVRPRLVVCLHERAVVALLCRHDGEAVDLLAFGVREKTDRALLLELELNRRDARIVSRFLRRRRLVGLGKGQELLSVRQGPRGDERVLEHALCRHELFTHGLGANLKVVQAFNRLTRGLFLLLVGVPQVHQARGKAGNRNARRPKRQGQRPKDRFEVAQRARDFSDGAAKDPPHALHAADCTARVERLCRHGFGCVCYLAGRFLGFLGYGV